MTQHFSFRETTLRGALLIEPFISTDSRGAFIKDYSTEVFEANGIHHHLKEVFYTHSNKGVIRAIHFQVTHQQAKLVRCITGKVYDVIVDLRPESATFGRWEGFYLSGDNHLEIFIPENFGHGYLVVEPAIVSYKANCKFYPEFDTGIKWDDEDIGIDWPLDLVGYDITVSDKDSHLPTFTEFKATLS